MTNETHQANTETGQNPFGIKLQQARESMNLDRKDAAAQLRLNEKYIGMMETDTLPADMPVVFQRGYIRAYGKLLQLSEDTIAQGLAPISTKSKSIETHVNIPINVSKGRKKSRYITHAVTLAVAVTVISLLASWWSNHSTKTTANTESSNGTIAVSLSTKPVATAAPTVTIVTAATPRAITAKATAARTTRTPAKKMRTLALQSSVKTKKALPSPISHKVASNNHRSQNIDDDDYYYD